MFRMYVGESAVGLCLRLYTAKVQACECLGLVSSHVSTANEPDLHSMVLWLLRTVRMIDAACMVRTLAHDRAVKL